MEIISGTIKYIGLLLLFTMWIFTFSSTIVRFFSPMSVFGIFVKNLLDYKMCGSNSGSSNILIYTYLSVLCQYRDGFETL